MEVAEEEGENMQRCNCIWKAIGNQRFFDNGKNTKRINLQKSVIQIKTWQRRNFKPFKFKFLKSLNELL